MRKFIALATILSFVLGPVFPILGPSTAWAEDLGDNSSGGAEILKTLNTGMQGAQGAMAQFGASQAQIMQMVQMGQNLGKLNGPMNQGFSLLSQVQASLAQELTKANECLQKADKSGDKKYLKLFDSDSKKQKKKFDDAGITLTTSQIESAEPSCLNYAGIINTAEFEMNQIDRTNSSLACIRNLQNNIEKLANQARQPFSQLSQAADEAIGIRDQLIQQYEDTASKITGDLEGENGYIAKLQDLKNLSSALNNTLNGAPGGSIKIGDQEYPMGLSRRIKSLEDKRNALANKWQYQIWTATRTCYANDATMECNANGDRMSPRDCINVYIDQGGGGAKAAVNARNADTLNRAMRAVESQMQTVKPTSLDINEMEKFLEYSHASFTKTKENMVNTLKRYEFSGGVSANDIGNFFGSKLEQCYNNEMKNFESSLKGSGGPYYDDYKSVKDEEKDLASAAQNWVNLVTEKMTSFQTSFTKTYNNGLKIFADGCGTDAYNSVDCLKKLSTLLRDGLEGRAPQGIIQMNVPVISLDAQGRPTQGSQTIACGLEECLNNLIKTRDYNRDQAAAQKREKEKFIQDHNKNVQTTMGAIATQFGAIANLTGPIIAKLNGFLGALGVSDALKTKSLTGEPLEKDERGVFKLPQDMKKAFAANSAYTEISNIDEVFGKLAKQKAMFAKKAVAAKKAKSECEVTSADYEGLVKKLDRSCKTSCDSLGTIAQSIEKIISKSSKTPPSKSYGRGQYDSSREFRSCFNYGANFTNADAMIMASQSNDEKVKSLQIKTKATQKRCVNDLVGDLSDKNTDVRSEYEDTNNNFIGIFEAMGNACVDGDAEKAKTQCGKLIDEAKGNVTEKEDGESKSGLSEKAE